MSTSKNLKARISELEAQKNTSEYSPPMIVVEVVQPDQSCNRVIVYSGPFEGCEFNRAETETSGEFAARVDKELLKMEAEIAEQMAC